MILDGLQNEEMKRKIAIRICTDDGGLLLMDVVVLKRQTYKGEWWETIIPLLNYTEMKLKKQLKIFPGLSIFNYERIDNCSNDS